MPQSRTASERLHCAKLGWFRYVTPYSNPVHGVHHAGVLIFKKGKHIAALKRTDAEKSAQLSNAGWEKQFEDVRAADAERALARLADMRKEEVTTERAFVTSSVFSSLLTAILR